MTREGWFGLARNPYLVLGAILLLFVILFGPVMSQFVDVKLAKVGAVIVADSPCKNSTKPGTSSIVSLLARCLRVMSQALCRRLALFTQTSFLHLKKCKSRT